MPSPEPVCPHCGFRIFNRRYAKCESCGRDLPEPLVYSADERAALITKEELEAAQRRPRRDWPTRHGAGDMVYPGYGSDVSGDAGGASDGGGSDCGGV
jgi:hypothetical protein